MVRELMMLTSAGEVHEGDEAGIGGDVLIRQHRLSYIISIDA